MVNFFHNGARGCRHLFFPCSLVGNARLRYIDFMNLEAFVLGCGGMMPLPYRHLTSVLLRRHGDLFLFDCAAGTHFSLRRLNLKWTKIDAIFISHTHADHITVLPGLMMLSSQVDRDEPV